MIFDLMRFFEYVKKFCMEVWFDFDDLQEFA